MLIESDTSALRVISVRHGTIQSSQYFGFLISDCRSEPIIDLLTNVLIVSAMLPPVSHNVDVLIQAGLEYRPGLGYRPGLEYRPGV